MSEWVAVDWAKIRTDWWNCTAGIGCVCGANGPDDSIILNDESEAVVCDACGRKYRMVAYVEVQEPPE